ncbi:MAG: AAA family ATPase [Prevotella sp.]|nr:AAA family ATPase [Prevotella sp.]
MKTELNIKNFRVFDENGVSFEFTPITILTGSNSSGKSSAVKAVFLLNSFLAQIKKAVANGETIELDKYKLDFTQYPNNLLGRFDKVINGNSNKKAISIGFSVHSLMLSKEVYVNLVFSADENDVLNNAFLESIEMSTDEGVFYSSSKSAPSYCNLNIMKEEFVTFLLSEFAIHAYCGTVSTYELEGGMTEEEYKSNIKTIIDYLRTVKRTRRDDILRYVRFSNTKKSIVEKKEECQFLEQVKEDDFIFSIPLLDELKDLDKDEVESFVTSHCMNNASKGFRAATKKVLETYKKSEFDTFDYFFHDFEHRYLEHVVCTGGLLKTAVKGVQILRATQLSLDNSFTFVNPCDSQSKDVSSDHVATREKETAEKKGKEILGWEQSELTFDQLCEIVMEWNRNFKNSMEMNIANDNHSETPYIYEEPSMWNPTGSVYHIGYVLLTKFAAAVVTEALTPEWGGNMSYVSSSRASVNRLYTLDSKDDFSTLLHNYFEKRRLFLDDNRRSILWPTNTDYVPDSFMNSWIKKFKIGDSISLDVDKEGLGVQIRLHKSSKNEGGLLADEGYGITQLVSILLQIETAILSAKGKKVNRYYGLDALDKFKSDQFHYEVNTISIEEPEIHLHPKYQSVLADMLVEACQKYNIQFVVETHSEYLIRKLQLLVSGHVEGIIADRSMVSIYYINSVEDKSKQKVKRIGICNDGYLDDSFGEGFYDEATRLSRQLM